MEKRLLLLEDKNQKVKQIAIMDDAQRLRMILGGLSWRILTKLCEREMYPLEIARELSIHEQKVYYHIHKLAKAGAVVVAREERKKGAIARYYRPVSSAFGIELPGDYKLLVGVPIIGMSQQLEKFYRGFISKDGMFMGKIVVGSPIAHGPFKTSARDGHYASHLAFFLGQFLKIPDDFIVKLDVDVKAEKEEKNNIILIGGPGTNVLTQEINERLPVKFIMQHSKEGYFLGGLMSSRTGRTFTGDAVGLLARISNPWDQTKSILVLAGNKAVGTKACVLALTSFWKKVLKKSIDEKPFATVIQGLDLDSDGKVDSVEILE